MIAYTTHPNTPETDAKTMVWHTVEWTHVGVKHQKQVLATDPQDAIRHIKQQHEILKVLT
jgi:hypothetical protein